MRYFSLDVHRNYCEGAELLPNNTVRRFRFPNELKAWKQFARGLDEQCKVALEATCNAFMIYDILSEHGAQVVLVNTLKTRAIAEARIKTDKLSAEILVRLLAADFICEVWVPPKEERELRTLLHHRAALKRQIVGVKNRIHAILMRHGIPVPVSDLFGVKGRRFLYSLEELPEVERVVLASNLKVLDSLEAEIKEIEDELYLRAQARPEVKILLGIPGIDVLAALTILAEIGDIRCFASAKKLASFAGLVPSVHQSGKVRYTGHITRAGRSMLRWILTQVALQAVRHPGPLREFYLRIRERKGHKVAIIAAARKLLTIIWVLLTRQTSYEGAREELRERKIKRMMKKGAPYMIDIDIPQKLVFCIEMDGNVFERPDSAA
mgnify:CR=1 FL=1